MHSQSDELLRSPERMERKLQRLAEERQIEQIALKHGGLVAE